MPEYITKEQALDAVLYLDDEISFIKENRSQVQDEQIRNMFTDIPPADVVKVVRCKDCKNLYADDNGKLHWCDCHRMFVGLDDFCNYGKREDGGERDD